MTHAYQPIILIGAARSGTKLVRDLVARHPSVDRVPYDVNFIWRIGNESLSHDELSPASLTPDNKRRIIDGIGSSSKGAPFLIEKTVSNCLRVAFVAAVFPEAKFIHLLRDGRDVVESVHRQWLAPPDWKYILQKALSFPMARAFGYGVSYVGDTFRKVLPGSAGKKGTWGPRYQGIDDDVANKDLLEVCARQWVLSVEKALFALRELPDSQVLTLRYEEFVRHPQTHLQRVADFAGIDPAFYLRHMTLGEVSQTNIGKGFKNLTVQQRELIQSHIGDMLNTLHYGPCCP